MEYVYAALLLHSAGKEINDAAITAILEAAGIKPDVAKVKALVSSLEGVNIDEAIKQSTTVPVAAPAPTEEKKEEEKKEEEKEEEKKAEEAAAGLSSLFG